MSRADVAVLTLYYLTLGVLTLLALHRLHLVRLRRRTHPPVVPASGVEWPAVAVQLPLYNEPGVAVRLLDAVAAMRYPGSVSIQVIDDSTDRTTSLVAERVAALAGQGHAISHVRRGTRDGYKAGALAHALRETDAALVAVFDADFVPPADFLERAVPYLADARVGMVQARWGHLNREESLLTRVQAIYLDAHFAVESAARNYSGRFFNFNGTAGIWRREAIEGAGGWSADTLTEDLDLSYRAQLNGWKFVFLEDLEVPAELPASVSAFQQQQERWAEGSIQTARKVLPAILHSAFPAAVKMEAAFHLTSNLAYLFSIALAVLIVPSVTLRYASGLSMLLALDLFLLAISTTSIVVFYVEGQRRAGRRRPTLRELLALMPLGLGISLRNGWAVARGLWRDGGEFKRTPKRGTAGPLIAPRSSGIPLPEAVMAVLFLGGLVLFVRERLWGALPVAALFLSGYAYVFAMRVREALISAKSDS